MKLCIICSKEKNKDDLRFLEASKKFFNKVFLIPFNNINLTLAKEVSVKYREMNLSKFDVAIFRIPMNNYNLAYFVARELSGVFVPQGTQSFLRCSNKIMLYDFLNKKGFKTPKTSFSGEGMILSKELKNSKFPVKVGVLDDRSKTMIANTRQEAVTMIDTLEALKQTMFLEEYKKGVPIYKILVIGGELLDAKKIINGKISEKKVSKKIKELGKDVCNRIGTDIGRVEILGGEELIISDVDLCPLLREAEKEALERYAQRIRELTDLEHGGIMAKMIDSSKLALKELFK